MEYQDLPSSPRKRLKLDMEITTSGVEPLEAPYEQPAAPDVVLSAIAKPSMDHYDMQLRKEEDVGITEFVSPDIPGFTGILKKRYTDFLVNEILPSGQVVHLDKLGAPKHGNKKHQSAQNDQTSPNTPAARSSTSVDVSNSHPIGTVENPDTHLQAPKSDVPSPETSTEELFKQENLGLVQTTAQSSMPAAIITDGATEAMNTTNTSNAEKQVAQWQAYASKPKGFKLTPADEAIMVSFFDSDVVQQIVALFNRILNSPHRKARDYGNVKSAPITNRELRTKIHQELRRIFASRLESYTDDDGSMVISAALERSQQVNHPGGGHGSGGRTDSGRQRQQRGNPGWKDLGGEYLHFTLYKENKDTMEVVSYLARQLKVQAKSFQFAGTKDRRAVTAQRVSVYRVYADRMASVGRTLRNAKIGNYEYQPRGLELGELTGNEFVITLRDCQFVNIESDNVEKQITAVTEAVGSAVDHLNVKGYLNYYGLQRFGTFSTRTDTIGKKMLQSDFQGAVDAILRFDPSTPEAGKDSSLAADTISTDDKARATAINSFRTTGKAYPALEILPRKFSAESSLIRHLGVVGRSNDYLGALQTIPRNLRLMYVHAYQSLIWNLAASHRWKNGHTELLPGDLVLVEEHKDKSALADEPQYIDVDGEVIIPPAVEDSAAPEEERFVRARVLSDEDIASRKYSISDIVLPMPGFDVLYPEHLLKDFYEHFMASTQGGGLDPHAMRRPWKDISLSGSYRKLLAKPAQDISFEIHTYTKDDEQFVETDLDRISKDKHPDTYQSAISNQQNGTGLANGSRDDDKAESQSVNGKDDQESVKKKIAVVLRMQLGSSQYATMVLRELMKSGGVKTYKPDFGGGR